MSSLEKPNSPDDRKKELENLLIGYLAKLFFYKDRPAGIISEATTKNIPLDFDTAVLNGFLGALEVSPSYVVSSNTESLELILEFAKEHGVSLDLKQPKIIQALENCYSSSLKKTDTPAIGDIKKFAKKHELILNINSIFQHALIQILQDGWGERANHLVAKMAKESLSTDISTDPKIIEALQSGLELQIQTGEAAKANWLITFAEKNNLPLNIQEEKFVTATKSGLKKCIAKMKLGPGSVSLAEQMVKFIRKRKLLIDLNDPEIITACRDVLQEITMKPSSIPSELRMFSAAPHIRHFLETYKIKI